MATCRLYIGLLAAALFSAPKATAGENNAARSQLYVMDLDDVLLGLNIPLEDKHQTISVTQAQIQQRIEGSTHDVTVDAIQLPVPLDRDERSELAEGLARPGKARALKRYFDRQMARTKGKPDSSTVSIRISAEADALMDTAALIKKLSAVHHHLTVPAGALSERRGTRQALLSQLAPFFTSDEMRKISSALAAGQPLDIDHDLLPSFARRSVTKYTKFRGPNCFHAALSFQDPQLPNNPQINFNEERGYHRSMINNDELWFALQHDFTEIDPRSEHLRYGDMIVFMDVPDETKTVDFHWVKHATTYLFGDYVFSKGSNAANTPYSVKTLASEWEAWERGTSHLHVKVFRYNRSRQLTASNP